MYYRANNDAQISLFHEKSDASNLFSGGKKIRMHVLQLTMFKIQDLYWLCAVGALEN